MALELHCRPVGKVAEGRRVFEETREEFRSIVSLGPVGVPEVGFTDRNTSGLTAAELVSLNRALGRLLSSGLSEYEAKVVIDRAVRDGVTARQAAEVDLERLLAWR